MYIAVDEFDKRIDVADAVKEQTYFCPVCHSPLIIRDGDSNAKHFAHRAGECYDDWNYDMSEWHRRMQGYFDVENREVVVNHNGKTHRADVMVGDIVIEFQHSSISASEFMDRNTFFQQLGKSIAWVFDVSEQYENNAIRTYEEKNNVLWTWKKPLRIISSGNEITDDSKDYAVWLYWSTEYDECIRKIVWTETEAGRPSLKKFDTSRYAIDLEERTRIDPELFFYSKKDYFKDKLKELKSKYPYSIKYCGKKGEHRPAYICPKRPDDFGIKLSSEKSCFYCKHCYMAAYKPADEEKSEKNMYAFYCCYPHQVRRLNGECEGHPGYDCNSVEVYEL